MRYRLELELPEETFPGGGVDISVWDGRIAGPRGRGTFVSNRIGGGSRDEDPHWMSVAGDNFWTTYLFDPDNTAGLPLRELDLRVVGKTSQAGWEAVRLAGVPVEESDHFPEPLWWGTGEYECLVDAERGVLLRCASRLNEEDFAALEVEEIRFDQRFGAEVFDSHQPLPWR